jgi:signal peptidase I
MRPDDPPHIPPASTEDTQPDAASSQSHVLVPQPQSSGSQPPNWWLSHRENIITILLALVLALGIRTFIAEARWIPSDSMLPTLEEGDRLVVEKVSYRFSSPQRGDIIVFNPPAYLDFPGAYIKRVIGLPGDEMQIKDGFVYVNGIPLSESYIAESPHYDCPGACPGITTEGETFTVPEDSYFVMGDNRNNSQDSHYFGFLPRKNIIGHTLVRFWPLDRLHYFPKVQYPQLNSSLR